MSYPFAKELESRSRSWRSQEGRGSGIDRHEVGEKAGRVGTVQLLENLKERLPWVAGMH